MKKSKTKYNKTMNAIEGSGLIVQKSKNIILDRLDLGIKKGSLTGLIGPSGSGKTTLMRAIVGVQEYSGTLRVLSNDAGDKRLRSKLGYVTQTPAIYIDISVTQNLEYFATIVGADKSKIHEIIKTVELEDQAKQLVGSLSGGQKARVSLAVALLGDPDILVLDEPTVGLDPVLREKLWQLFRSVAQSGKTLLISSHVMDEADRCDELLLLRDGRVLWNDNRKKLLQSTKTTNVNEAFLKRIGAKP